MAPSPTAPGVPYQGLSSALRAASSESALVALILSSGNITLALLAATGQSGAGGITSVANWGMGIFVIHAPFPPPYRGSARAPLGLTAMVMASPTLWRPTSGRTRWQRA